MPQPNSLTIEIGCKFFNRDHTASSRIGTCHTDGQSIFSKEVCTENCIIKEPLILEEKFSPSRGRTTNVKKFEIQIRALTNEVLILKDKVQKLERLL